MRLTRTLALVWVWASMLPWASARGHREPHEAGVAAGDTWPQPLYYIQTNEGLIQHLRQLDILAEIAETINRTVLALPFPSHHYPDVEGVDVCRVFEMPSYVRCVNVSLASVFSQTTCYYTGIAFQPFFYRHPEVQLPVERNPDYATIGCLAGPLNRDIGKYPREALTHRSIFNRITPEYLAYLTSLRTILGAASVKYVVVHWRRGDQLLVRCKPGFLHPDGSVNCGTLDEFLTALNISLARIPGYSPVTHKTYIATNEEDAATLGTLQQQGYSLFSSIEPKVKLMKPNMTTLDAFMFELLLMCDAAYFVCWGESSIHRYVRAYRRAHDTESGVICESKGGATLR